MQLIHGDCYDILPQIHDKTIDMVMCDLPYNTTDCAWDCPINLTWLFSEYFRILKKNGVIALTASQPFTSKLVYEHQSSFKVEWIWKKNAGSNFGTVKFQPMKEHESILIFSNGGGRVTYNPQMQQRAESGLSRVRSGIVNYNTSADVYGSGGLVGNQGVSSNRPDERYPSSVQNWNRERGLHPTQKPISMLEYFIKTYSNENETVLDNTMGSGSTGVACINTNRNFIGIEKDDKYFEIAKKRIEEHLTTAST